MVLTLVALALALTWWWLMSLERFGRPLRLASARVQGHLLEVLLYGAFPGVLLRSLGAVARASLALSLSLLLPSLLFTVPLLAAVVITGSFYAYRPAQVGEPILVTLEGSSDWQLQTSAQYEIAARFRHPYRPLQIWRLRPLAAGNLSLEFRNGSATTLKSLRVAEGGWISRARHRPGWAWLLSPLEPPLPSGLRQMTVLYAPRELGWMGYSAPWWLLLLLAFAGWSWLLALKRPPWLPALPGQVSSANSGNSRL